MFGDRQTSSGIYVATLRSDDWVPVTQDPRYVAVCARVNCTQVKVGKARNLSLRQRNYCKDFGAGNVIFSVLALTLETNAAETAVLRRLARFRKRSPKGRMMDWLEGITVDEVVAEVFAALIDARIEFVRARGYQVDPDGHIDCRSRGGDP